MSYFFITGLPRSRTTWLSVLFTMGDSFCFHEGCKYAPDIKTYIKMLDERSESYVGDSSCAPLIEADMPSEFDDAPLVVINRDPKQVLKSVLKMWPHVDAEVVQERLGYLSECLGKIERPHLSVDFEELENISTLREIWRHCLPDVDFDEGRASALQRISIAPHWKKEEQFLLKGE